MDGGIVTHRGLSLIELLIAMALGLTLAAGVVQVYAGNSQAARALEARIRVQETGRLALHFLMQTLREARYPGCVRGWEAANSSPGDALDSDRMAKVVNSQQGDWLPSAGASLESFARVAASDVIWAGDTCAGTARQGTYVYVGKRGNDVQNPPALFLRHTSAGRAEELFEGVASMQILYGVDSGAGSSIHYVVASDVGDWTRLRSLRIDLLLQSVHEHLLAAPQSYVFHGVRYDSTALPDDTRLRRVFSATLARSVP